MMLNLMKKMKRNKICEEFLGFLPLRFNLLEDQGYDRCATMANCKNKFIYSILWHYFSIVSVTY